MHGELGAFGALLLRHRAAAGFSQEELAERAGLSRRGIADLERSRRRAPYPATVRRLADALGLAAPDRAELLTASRHVGVTTTSTAAGMPESSAAPAPAQHNLPAELSSFVGRDRAIAEVRRLLGTTRVLTLTGAGGVGKTRLVLRAAATVADSYAHGVWLVDLAPHTDAALVAKAVASSLNICEQPGRPTLDTLADALRRRHILLVLDNCEHLVQSCAELVQTLLSACPNLRVLTTSRQALRVPGEMLWWVPSLDLPDTSGAGGFGQTAGAEAVQLFVDRGAAVLPGFALSEINAATIAQICSRLDGVPLALELAAARLSTLSVEQVAARLDDRFKLLTGGSRTALARQQTLRGTLDWSHDLLTDRARMLLRRLAVFAGGWSLEAAETVCAGDGLEAGDVLDLLAELVGKSLVGVESLAEAGRYRLLETVRQYAREKLFAAGEADILFRRQRDWCLALAEDAEPQLYLTPQVRWLDCLEREHDNLRVALAWSHTHRDDSNELARLVSALWRFWYLRGHLDEGRRWLDQAMSVTELSSERAGVLLGAGWLAYGLGELDRAADVLEQSLDLARDRDDRRTAAHALMALSFTLRDHGERRRSNRCSTLLDESLALSREIGFRWAEAFSLYLTAGEAAWRGDRSSAAEYCAHSLAVFRELGDRLGLAYALHELAQLALDRGDEQHAIDLDREALVLSRELGNRRGICFALTGLAKAARRRGEYVRASELLRQALLLWRELGNPLNPAFTVAGLAAVAAEQRYSERAARLFGAADARLQAVGAGVSQLARGEAGYDEAIAIAREDLGEAAFSEAWAAGQTLGFDKAIDEALTCPEQFPIESNATDEDVLGRLSPREREGGGACG